MDKKIYYICKYTPIELLEGYGFQAERLDPAPASFACAEECTHPNMCGYGKAVLEEIFQNDIKNLFLVDCCDVCRRIYDILDQKDCMDFLYLMTLPHKKGKDDIALLERELNRLGKYIASCCAEESADQKSAEDCIKAYYQRGQSALQEGDGALQKTSPAIRLTGAHGGRLLKEMIEKRLSLPVLDETCTGDRALDIKPGIPDLTIYASALLGQANPCMRMQFEDEMKKPPGGITAIVDVKGTICHTIKFCDYYSFKYRGLIENNEENLLKIETDCSSQSTGQLITRLDAFAEMISQNNIQTESRKKDELESKEKYFAGIDSGSASTDAVVIDSSGNILGFAIIPTGKSSASGAEKALEQALENANIKHEDLCNVITTGYGRENTGISGGSVTEITCHARGAHHLYPDAGVIIDIGGQDSKVILTDEKGNVINFVMNDKCAAGTGRFLETMAKTLELSLPEMSRLGLDWKNEITITSMCTVFAESEVVSLIAANTATEDIIHGLNRSIAAKTAPMVKRLGNTTSGYIMTGGVAKNQGVVKALEEILGSKVFVHEHAQICGALGAAIIASEL